MPGERVIAPSGLWIVLRPEIGAPGWVVWVYDFATWKHRKFNFTNEASARVEYMRWTL